MGTKQTPVRDVFEGEETSFRLLLLLRRAREREHPSSELSYSLSLSLTHTHTYTHIHTHTHTTQTHTHSLTLSSTQKILHSPEHLRQILQLHRSVAVLTRFVRYSNFYSANKIEVKRIKTECAKKLRRNQVFSNNVLIFFPSCNVFHRSLTWVVQKCCCRC